MSLTPPASREPIHHRRIDCRGYRRGDGLWDIEGRLVDVKSYAFPNAWRGEIRPGEPLHEMWLRLTLDDDLTVVRAEAATEAGPFAVCPAITPAFARLEGLRIGPGWRRAVQARLGGVQGCTHLVELLARSRPPRTRPSTLGARSASRGWRPISRPGISTAATRSPAAARWCARTIPAGTRGPRMTLPIEHAPGSGAPRVLVGRQRRDRERMDVGAHQLTQRLEHHALTLDPTGAGEGLRHYGEAEVRFAFRTRAGMARMAGGLVHEFDPGGVKSGLETIADGACDPHGSASALPVARGLGQNTINGTLVCALR